VLEIDAKEWIFVPPCATLLMVARFGGSAEQTLRIEPFPDILCSWGDETRLIQVVGNLINNAIKFSIGRDDVSRQKSTRLRSLLVCVTAVVESLRNSFRAFYMFVQGSRMRGVSPGLALVWHGQTDDRPAWWRIEPTATGLIEEASFGSCCRGGRTSSDAHAPVAGGKLTVLGADRMRVLIVDDNVDAANTLSEFLKLAGYQTHVAYDGRTASKWLSFSSRTWWYSISGCLI